MEKFSDNEWHEGRNLKEEVSRKVKSKHHKAKNIQHGIETYFLLESGADIDDMDDEQPDDIYYH